MKIENIVASTSIAEELNLNEISTAIPETKYEPKRFPGLVLRIREPKTAALLFSSSKFVCTGAKNIEDVRKAISKVCEKVAKIGAKLIKEPQINVQNIVASANLHSEINLNAIAVAVGLEKVEYEPEQFPGLVYRLDDPCVVALLFGSGKLVCTGARFSEQVSKAIDKISKELNSLGLLHRCKK
jgi:transcription initiation factor TFIID TATA-box-binding protein